MRSLLTAFLLLLAGSCLADSDESSIRQLLAEQQSAWNRGDLDGFMAGYWRSEQLRFASGDSITYGWQPTLARYRQRYADRKQMGTLAFEILDVKLMTDQALVFGRWRLTREKDQPQGLFSLLLQKRLEGWRIIADHTS